MDEIIIFNDLTIEDVEKIVLLQMQDVSSRLVEQGLAVELTPAACAWLARQGFDAQFGARPLRRALQRHIESPLSVRLLRGEFERGDLVLIDAGDEGLLFQRRPGEGKLGEKEASVVIEETVSAPKQSA